MDIAIVISTHMMIDFFIVFKYEDLCMINHRGGELNQREGNATEKYIRS